MLQFLDANFDLQYISGKTSEYLDHAWVTSNNEEISNKKGCKGTCLILVLKCVAI